MEMIDLLITHTSRPATSWAGIRQSRAVVARQAHNLKDAGSSPASATIGLLKTYFILLKMTAGKDRQADSLFLQRAAPIGAALLCPDFLTGGE